MSLSDADPEPSDDGVVAFRRRGVTIGEAYFSAAAADAPGLSRIDLLRIVAAFSPQSERGARKRHTLVIDLDDDEDRLLEQMSKDTRSKIRRAMQKDPLEVTAAAEPSAAQVEEFADFYDRFASAQSVAAQKPQQPAAVPRGRPHSGRLQRDVPLDVSPHRAREPARSLSHPALPGAQER